MKKLIALFIFFLQASYLFSQDASRNTIITTGIASKTLYPKTYKIRFLLQEEMQSQSQKGVIKTHIDTIKLAFFENMKAYGFKESDFAIVKKSSQPGSGYPANTTMYNIVYELKDQKGDLAQRLVNDLRFSGLKGVVAKPIYSIITRVLQDSLYAAALADAHANAVNIARIADKSIGEVYNINTGYGNNFWNFNNEQDQTDIYNLSKFEFGFMDNKQCQVTVNATYQLMKKSK